MQVGPFKTRSQRDGKKETLQLEKMSQLLYITELSMPPQSRQSAQIFWEYEHPHMTRIVAGGTNHFLHGVSVESLISDHVVRSESFQPHLGTCDAKPFSSSQMQLNGVA